MSGGKFAKQQKRRRWCDQGLLVPASYRAALQAYGSVAADSQEQQAAAAGFALKGQPDEQLAKHLLHFVSIQFTYGEVEELKTTIAAADKLAAAVDAGSSTWYASMQLLLELLFVQNSRPLHRQILAWVRKLSAAHQVAIGWVVGDRIQQEATAGLQQQTGQQEQLQDSQVTINQQQKGPQTTDSGAAAARGLNLAQAAVSLLWLPASRPWMQPCSAALLHAVAHSIQQTLDVSQPGKHLTPNTMELVQDAISVMYYTLQHHGQHLATAAGQQGAAAIAAAAECMLEALQGTALVREAMASAAVVVWSAAVLPNVPPAAAAAVFAEGITPQQLQEAAGLQFDAAGSHHSNSSSLAALQQDFSRSSILEQLLQQKGSSLVNELQRLSPVGRVCALKGLLTAMPAEALAADLAASAPPTAAAAANGAPSTQQQASSDVSLHVSSSSNPSRSVTFIMQCVLPFAVQASQAPIDSHYKFHAVSVAAIALQRARQIWQDMVQQQGLAATAEAAAAATDGVADIQLCRNDDTATSAAGALTSHTSAASSSDGAGTAASAVSPPWLAGDGLLSVVELLWGNLDEPMAQTLAKVQDAFEALLELLVYQDTAAAQLGLQPPSLSGSSTSSSRIGAFTDTTSFLQATAAAVLAVPANKKGRYSPLTSLLPRVGATHLLQRQQGLVQQVLGAMQDDMIANSASAFFKAMLLQLRRECRETTTAAAAGAAGGLAAQDQGSYNALPEQQQQQREGLMNLIPDPELRSWCLWWLPELLNVLWGPNDRFRTYVTNHALPVVLNAEPLLLRPMVDMILAAYAAAAGPPGSSSSASSGNTSADCTGASSAAVGVANATAALVVVLKAARRLQLVGNLDTLLTAQEQQQLEQQYLGYSTSSSSTSRVSSEKQPAGGAAAAAAANGVSAAGGSDANGTSSSSSQGLLLSPAGLLLSAVSSASAALRLEALELACVNARSTDPPGVLELCIARRWLLLCLRCTGAGSRSKCLVLCDKLITRQRAAVYAILHRAAVAKKPGATGGAHPGSLPKASVNHLAPPTGAAASAASDGDVLLRQYDFIRWMSQTLMDSLYPGGPYERKYFALEVLALLLQQWKPASSSITDYQALAASAAPSASSSSSSGADHLLRCPDVVPVSAAVLSSSSVQVLLGCLVDTWDKLRMAAARVLELLPSPLPGVSSPEQVTGLLSWAVQLTQSPRVRESDAGARLLRLLLLKYTLDLHWELQVWPQPSALPPCSCSCSSSTAEQQKDGKSSKRSQTSSRDLAVGAVVQFLGSLSGDLRSQLLLAQTDLAAASRRGLVHGVVLTLRYMIEEIPWSKISNSRSAVSLRVGSTAAGAAVQQQDQTTAAAAAAADGSSNAVNDSVFITGSVSEVLRAWLDDLLLLLLEVARLAQPHLSAQDVNVAADEVEEDDDSASDMDADVDDDADLDVSTTDQPQPDSQAQQQSPNLGLSGPAIQLLTTACWTSVKEVFLLFGTLARKLPMPDGSGSSSSSNQSPANPSSSSSSSSLLQIGQLAAMGDMQLSLLLSMKHNGAVEKSQAGFLWLCERLLQSSSSSLNSFPGVWLNRCLERVQQPGQCRDDIVRRSAGLPFAMSCLFLSEPPGVPRQLLPHGLQQLLDIADNQEAAEPWPRVHAFNVLRCVFNDSAMALDSSGFHAAGVAAAIRGMAADAWEVRNAAALTFTALVMRVIGYKNAGNKGTNIKPLQQLAASPADLNTHCSDATAAALAAAAGSSLAAGSSSNGVSSGSRASEGKRSWCQKSPTATEFFYRYPQLHSFLLEQLQTAAALSQQQQQRAGSSGSSRSGSEVPPSLFPVLVILSRLKPSLMLTNLRHVSSSSSGSSNAVDGAAAAAGEGCKVSVSAATAENGALSPNALIPAVLSVGRSPSMGGRQIAALSLPPLVPADQLHHICQGLARLLPLQQQQEVSSSSGPALQLASDHNALHGTLLQLNALLSAVAGSSSDGSSGSNSSSAMHVSSLVAGLLPAFVSSSWIAGSSSCSSAVRQAYITAAGQLIMLAYRHWPLLLQLGSSNAQEMQQLVDSLSSCCEAEVQRTVPGQSAAAAAAVVEATDPQHCCWLRDSTAMLLGPLLRMQLLLLQQQAGSSIEVCDLVQQLLILLEQRLLPCMGSGSYEVRASALKAAAVQLDHILQLNQQHPGLLAVAMQASPPDTAATAAAAALDRLSSALWLHLESEKTVKGLKRLLVVLGQLQRLQSALQQQHTAAATAADDALVLQHLKAALATARQCRQVDVRIAALTCAAHKIRPVVDSFISSRQVVADSSNTAKQYIQCMQQLLQLVHGFSQYHQPEEIREAAAHALDISGLLWPLAGHNACDPVTNARDPASGNTMHDNSTSTAVARLSLSAWSCALRLFEDEEDMVRQPAANAAQAVLSAQAAPAAPPAGRSVNARLCDQISGLKGTCHETAVQGFPTSSTGQYVEAVEQSTFADLLAKCTIQWPDLVFDVVQLLSGIVFDSSTAVPEVLLQQCRRQEKAAAAGEPAAGSPAVAAPAVLAGVLVRRLFEKEADNHHEEPVLLAQHAAAALRQVLLVHAQHGAAQAASTAAGAAAAAADKLILNCCKNLTKYLTAVVNSLSVVSSSAAGGWVGGDTNHPEVFVPLYHGLLGLWAAAPSWTGAGTAMSADMPATVGQLVGQLMQLEPSVLLIPLLQDMQRACEAGVDAAAAGSVTSGVLFLVQN